MTSELDIENHLIQILSEQENQWRYRPDLTSEAALWENFRRPFKSLEPCDLRRGSFNGYRI